MKTKTKKSWKTSLLGFLTLGLAFAPIFIKDVKTQEKINQVVVVATGLGLMAARDNKVTSEDVGAKQ